jgi:N-acetylglutamate synthase
MSQQSRPSFHLRQMTPDDFSSCAELWSRCEGVVMREWENPQALRALLVRNPGASWVVEQGSLLLGAILSGHDGWRGYVYHAAVDPAWQRAGLGALLVHHVLENFSHQGIRRVHALVSVDNMNGRAFWRAMGATLREDVDILTLDVAGWCELPMQ